MKYFILIPDGMADEPIAELGDLTPMQKANKPCMNALAKRSMTGTVSNVPPQGGRKHPQQETIPVDTTNILFICGGAFDGLEQIIEKRKGNNVIGFGGEIKKKREKKNFFIIVDIKF